jgi:hypothetical protein
MRGQGSAFFLLRAKDKGIIAYWYRMSMITCKWFVCCRIAGCLLELAPGKTGASAHRGHRLQKPHLSRRAKDGPPKIFTRLKPELPASYRGAPATRHPSDLALHRLVIVKNLRCPRGLS